MSDRETPAEKVGSIVGADPDVVILEERLERFLAAPIDGDAAWVLVRDRIGSERRVVPLRTRRRRFRPLMLAIAAALLVSGVALAAGAQRSGGPERQVGPDGTAPRVLMQTGASPEAGERRVTPTAGSGPSGPGPSPATATVPTPTTSTVSPSSEASTEPAQQPGQDQQAGQDQESPDPSAQDQ